VVRFLLSIGARVKDVDDPVFNLCAKALMQEEVQKLEVPIPMFLLRLFLSGFFLWFILHVPPFMS
jgi:hypothetical protein